MPTEPEIIARKSLLNKLLTRRIGRLEYAGWLILLPVLSISGLFAVGRIRTLLELFGLYPQFVGWGDDLKVLLGIFISWFLVALPGHWRLGGLNAARLLKILYWFASFGLPLAPPLLYYTIALSLSVPPNPLELFLNFYKIAGRSMVNAVMYAVQYLWLIMVCLWLCYQLPLLLLKKLPKFLTRKI